MDVDEWRRPSVSASERKTTTTTVSPPPASPFFFLRSLFTTTTLLITTISNNIRPVHCDLFAEKRQQSGGASSQPIVPSFVHTFETPEHCAMICPRPCVMRVMEELEMMQRWICEPYKETFPLSRTSSAQRAHFQMDKEGGGGGGTSMMLGLLNNQFLLVIVPFGLLLLLCLIILLRRKSSSAVDI